MSEQVEDLARPTLRLAVDIGGTFTDLAAFDESGGRLMLGKSLSTHDNLADGIRDTAHAAGVSFSDAFLFLHGSTIAINALLERTGARTALLITEGFRDIYEIGRINRPDAYNLFFERHVPLVGRSLRLEVGERVMADGAVLQPLDEARLRETARELQQRGVQAVAILLLHSYRNPMHERRAVEILREVMPDAFVTASHELSQEYREFERASTVVANAYIGPRVQAYLDGIGTRLAADGFGGGFHVMQSTGGLFSAAEARRSCVRMLESGPAAGVIGTAALCRQLGMADAIAFDMGGTTAKAGLVHGYEPMTTGHALIGRYDRALPIQIPMIDIFEVGTGGGSIAGLVEGGALRVGPRSAGSLPGPACYGRGGREPTVTDANLLLGRLDAEHFLGGEMSLDLAAAHAAVLQAVAAPLGLDVDAAAEGIVRIAVTAMSYAVKGVTTDRGVDLGRFAMVVYGGAGPLHASACARELGIRRVIIPFSPGHFSAFGMLFADLRSDHVTSCFHGLEGAPFEDIETLYDMMEAQGRDAVVASGAPPQAVSISRSADMRYVGQEHAVTVALPSRLFVEQDREGIKAAFDAEHLQRYGTSAPQEGAEIVSVRSTVVGSLRKPPPSALAAATKQAAPDRHRPVHFEGHGVVRTPVYARGDLLAGMRIAGPALIEEHASTTVLQPGDALLVDPYGNLDIEIGGRS